MAGIVAIRVLEVSAATNSVRSEDAAMPKTDSDDMIREVLSYELGLVVCEGVIAREYGSRAEVMAQGARLSKLEVDSGHRTGSS